MYSLLSICRNLPEREGNKLTLMHQGGRAAQAEMAGSEPKTVTLQSMCGVLEQFLVQLPAVSPQGFLCYWWILSATGKQAGHAPKHQFLLVSIYPLESHLLPKIKINVIIKCFSRLYLFCLFRIYL